MIDDLQHGADVVGCGPRRPALAMHVEHKAPDRHRRIAAIVDQLVPIGVAMLGNVQRNALSRSWACWGDRLRSASAARRQYRPGYDHRGRAGLPRGDRGARACPSRSGFVVGDVVGDPHEFVERQDRRGGAVARSATKRPENSRPPSPCRTGAARHPKSWGWYHKQCGGRDLRGTETSNTGGMVTFRRPGRVNRLASAHFR